jgi:hypothetical protein
MQADACIPEIEPFGSISTKRPEGATGFWGRQPPFWLVSCGCFTSDKMPRSLLRGSSLSYELW